jgi:hypothetical protein
VVLVDFLRANADIFAWSPSDMPGIPREVAELSLDILPHARAVQQRLGRFDELAKIASGRITVPPNVFFRDIAQPCRPRASPLEPRETLGGSLESSGRGTHG